MSDEIDVTGLTAKRDQLLGEVKDLKARLRDVEAERDEAMTRAEKAEGDFQRVTIDEPVERLLADICVVPIRHVLPEVKEHFRFERGDDGQLQFRTASGDPVEIEGREAECTAEDVRKALLGIGTMDEVLRGSLASGGGAPGGDRKAETVHDGNSPRASVASPFGLR